MVERNLAKVEVESSRLFSRSNSKGSTLNMLPFFIGGKANSAGENADIVAGCLLVFQLCRMRRGNKAVMYRIANPASPVRLRAAPPSSPWPANWPRAFLFHNALSVLFGPSGEIGRHSGLKIRRFVNSGRTGSIPVSGTTARQDRFKPPTFIWWSSRTISHLKTG